MRKVKCPKCGCSFHPEKIVVNMVDLARAAHKAINAIVCITDTRYRFEEHFYVNKTRKYISIKFPDLYLNDQELSRVGFILKKRYPDRYLHIANGTARSWRHGFLVKEDKVMVRFTQK